MTEKKTRSREGWTRVRFGDVVRLSGERCTDPLGAGIERYVGLEHLEPGDLRIRSWGNVADGVTFTNRFRPGQVLFGKRRAYQRKVAVADFDGICSSDIYVFQPSDDRLLPELLPFICQTDGFFEHALKTSAGSLSPRTNWTSLSEYEFDLPPAGEQTRITQLLSTAETATTTADCARIMGDFCIRSYLHTLFNATAAARAWPWVPIGEIADVRTGIARHAAKEDSSWESFPYITVSHVQDGYVDLTDRRMIRIPESLVPRYELLLGDVLMTEGGDLDKLGRGTVWRENSDRYLHQNHVFAVRPDATRLRSEWLSSAARSSLGRAYFLGCAKRTSNLASINKTQVAAFRIPLPPLRQQDGFLAELSGLEAASSSLHQHHSRLRRLATGLASALMD